MAANTKIQWAHHTFNPWRGCTKIAPGCANCYADAQSKRNPATLGVWGPSGTRVVASEAMWRQPIKWDRESAQREESYRIAAMTCRSEYDIVEAPERPRVFCASLADVFEDWRGPVIRRQSELAVCHGCGNFGSLAECIDCGGGDALCSRMPRKATLDDVRARLFRLIDATPNLDWLLLTKRPENVRQMLPRVDCVVYRDGDDGLRTIGIDDEDRGGALRQYRSNVWLGVSIACQDDADRLIPELLKCRDLCAKTFLSIEPLIGPVDISQWIGYNPLHENNSQRRSGVRGRQDGTSASAGRRVSVETEIPSQKSVDRAGRDNEREDTDASRRGVRSRVSPSQDNDGRASGDVLGPPIGVAALQGPDPERHADKSQGRRQNQQSSGQSGSVFGVGQHEACSPCWVGVPKGDAQQSQQVVADGCGGDPSNVCGREGNASDDSGEVLSFASSSVKDSSRRSDDDGGGTNSGLHASSTSRNEPRCERQISFVIVGGESGPNARPCNIDWLRSIVRQCSDADVPCFVKQVGTNAQQSHGEPLGWPERTRLRDKKGGDPAEWPEDLRVRKVPT